MAGASSIRYTWRPSANESGPVPHINHVKYQMRKFDVYLSHCEWELRAVNGELCENGSDEKKSNQIKIKSCL